MKTELSVPIPSRPQPSRLLLPEFCPASHTAPDLDPRLLSLRAAAITSLMADIVEQKGYYHGGINE